MAAATLLVFLLCVVGLHAAEFYHYQEKSRLEPQWIRLINQEGSKNVSIEYEGDRETTCHWFVNGMLVTDGDSGIRVSSYRLRYEKSYNGIDEESRKTSVLIPATFSMTSLQVRLTSNRRQTSIDINPLLDIAPGKSVLEYIPKYEFKIDPVEKVQYNMGDTLRLHIYLNAKDMIDGEWEEPKVEFFSIDTCITPPRLDIKTSLSDGDFLHVYRPGLDDDLNIDEIFVFDRPGYIIRHVVFPTNVSSSLPRGVLKLTAGYRHPRSCQLFQGIQLSRSVFLQPPPHDYLFPANTSVFDTTNTRFSLQNGDDLEMSIRTFGGGVERDRYWDYNLVNPEIKLRKDGQRIQPIAVVNRLFETEAYFRFQNISAEQAGRYQATATVNNSTKVREDFRLSVMNTC